MSRPVFLFEFPIFPIRDIFEPAFFAPFLDAALDGFGIESHRGGEFAVGLAVELVGERFKVFQLLGLALCGCGNLDRGSRSCESEEDPFVVPYDYFGDGLGCGVVCVGADELRAEVAVFHYAEGREEHSYAECYDSEAADGGYEFISAIRGVF